MAEISILSVCGSGVVTSHMVANKLVEMFEDEGYDVTTDECNPSELDGYLTRGSLLEPHRRRHPWRARV